MLDKIKTSEINFYNNEVDKTAPRFRVSKFRYNVVNKEMIEKFVKDTGIKIDFTKFKEIVKCISETIIDNVLIERNGVQLPEQMGKNWLGLFKSIRNIPHNPNVRNDYFDSFNRLESGGLTGKIVWDFRGLKYKVKNREMYMFLPHRNFKTKASKGFINNPEIYLKIDAITRIAEAIKIREQIKNEQQNDTRTSK